MEYLLTKPHLIESLLMACIQKNKKVSYGSGKAAYGFVMADSLASVKTEGGIFLNRVPDDVWRCLSVRLASDLNALNRFQKWNPCGVDNC